ncbi:MAG: hypothetical protein V1708_03270 [Candidatus Micrarchaeota archaeon]
MKGSYSMMHADTALMAVGAIMFLGGDPTGMWVAVAGAGLHFASGGV